MQSGEIEKGDFEKLFTAIDLFREGLKEPGVDAGTRIMLHIWLGQALYQAGDYEPSKEQYSKVLEASPDPKTNEALTALHMRGHINRLLGNAQDAYEDLNTAVGLGATWPDTLAERGYVLMSFGRLDGAITDFSYAIESLGDAVYDELLLSRGDCYFHSGEFAKAITDYEAAALLPNASVAARVRARMSSGVAYLSLKDCAGAEASLKLAREMDPSDWLTNNAMANVYLECKAPLYQPEKAVELARAALLWHDEADVRDTYAKALRATNQMAEAYSEFGVAAKGYRDAGLEQMATEEERHQQELVSVHGVDPAKVPQPYDPLANEPMRSPEYLKSLNELLNKMK